jgi:hypothetical protein
MIGVRNTFKTSEKDPLSFRKVKQTIPGGRMVVRMPVLPTLLHGRDAGYKIEQVDLGEEIHSTFCQHKKRKENGYREAPKK